MSLIQKFAVPSAPAVGHGKWEGASRTSSPPRAPTGMAATGSWSSPTGSAS